MKKRIFFDMDGTLNKVTDALLDESGKVQVEKIYKENNFYLNIKPEPNVIDMVRELKKSYGNNVELFVLSACELGDPPGFEKQKDKWLDKHEVPIKPENRIYIPLNGNKADYIPKGLRDGDILIDDYNKNLEEFRYEYAKAGKKCECIKVVTEHNDRGLGLCGGEKNDLWQGKRVYTDKSAQENIKLLFEARTPMKDRISKAKQQAQQINAQQRQKSAPYKNKAR